SMHAFSQMKMKPGISFLKEWTERTIDTMSLCNHRDIVGNLCSLSDLRIQPSPAFHASWTERATELADGISLRDLLYILRAHAVLNLKPAPTLIKATQKLSKDAGTDFYITNRTETAIWSLAVLHAATGDEDIRLLAENIRCRMPK